MKVQKISENRFNTKVKRNVIEDVNNSFHLEFTVDGIKSSQDVSAMNMNSAKELIRKQYSGKTVTFTNQSNVKNEDYDSMSLFDDDVSVDDFSEILSKPSVEDETPLSHPQSGENNGIANMLNALIIDEYEAIKEYNDAIENIKQLGMTDMIDALNEVVKDEQNHVGVLQSLMSIIVPNFSSNIVDGEKEAEDVSVKKPFEPLKVQSFVKNSGGDNMNGNENVGNVISDMCSISNIDDEF